MASASLTQSAYERLRLEILSCRLRPGERIKINDICAQFSVSLGAVREALSRLTAEGLVLAEPQRGFRVTPISEAELMDLTNTRIEIEALCLRRAMARGDVAWEAGVISAFHQLSRAQPLTDGTPKRLTPEWYRLHRTFHDALVGACDSPWLLRLRVMLFAQSERYHRLSVPLALLERNTDDEHRAIMEAVIGRDGDTAVSLVSEHMLVTMRILLDADVVAQAVETAAVG